MLARADDNEACSKNPTQEGSAEDGSVEPDINSKVNVFSEDDDADYDLLESLKV